MKKTISILPLLMLTVALLGSANVPSSRAQGSTTFLGIWNDLKMSSQIVDSALAAGTSFTAEVNVTLADAVTTLNGYDVTVRYDPAVLDATGVSFAGGIFAACPNTPCFLLKQEVDVTPGVIRVAVVILGGTASARSGTLFSISYTVRTEGQTAVNIVETDATGTPVTTLTNPGAVAYTSIDGFFSNVPAPKLARGKLSWTHHLGAEDQTFRAVLKNPSTATIFYVYVEIVIDGRANSVTFSAFIRDADGTGVVLVPGQIDFKTVTVPKSMLPVDKYDITATLWYNAADLSIIDPTYLSSNSKSGAFASV